LKDVSYLRIEAYSEHPEVREMADLIVDSYLSQLKRKNPEKYIRPARKLIASIWLRDTDTFRFGTKTEYFGKKKRKQVWMTQPVRTLFRHMKKIGLISERVPYIPPELAFDGVGKSAIYQRSQSFKETLKDLSINDVIPDPDLPRIQLRNVQNFWEEIDQETQNQEWFQVTEATLKRQDELIAEANVNFPDGTPVHPLSWMYVRKFKELFHLTGRFYAAFTTWKKEKRLSIRFNDVPACSLDLSQLHPTLILRIRHGVEKETGMFTGLNSDPYDMPSFKHLDRSIHKTLINACFNAKDIDSAASALMNAYYEWDAEENEYDCTIYKTKKKRVGIKCFPGNKEEALKYIEAFKLQHPQLADALCTGIGLTLQKLDSDFMLNVIRLANLAEIPVLPVHDEIVFPSDKQEHLEMILGKAFSWTFGDAGSFGQLTVKRTQLDEEPTPIFIGLD